MPESMEHPEHEPFMRRCFELARLAFDHGNTPVGSVIVLDGQIISEGIEQLPNGMDITGHAELIAVQNAVTKVGQRSLPANACLYSTAEPCFMCSYTIRNAGISQVVYCLDTPLTGGVSSSMPVLTEPSLNSWRPAPTIVSGILQREFHETKAHWQAKP